MNYSGYVPGQLQQSNEELHVPTTLRHAHSGQPPGIEMAIPSLSFHHPSELTQAMQRSLGPGLPAPGVYQHQASGAAHREMDAYAVSSSSQNHMNPPPALHASLVHVSPLADVLPYLTNQSEDPHHHGHQRGSAESNVGTINRTVMQGSTMSSQPENEHFFRNDNQHQQQHQQHQSTAEDVPLAGATDPQGNHELHVMQLPKKAHRVHKVRKPLGEGRLNTGGPGVATSSTMYPTLPGGFKYKLSNNDDGVKTVVGVMSSRVIEMGEKFGPFTGCLLDEEADQELDSTWEIVVRGKVKFYVDGRDKTHKNWMVHVRYACSAEEQNLEAFQSYGDIYFRALVDIQPGVELKVFYCKDYREKIGCQAALADMTYKTAAETFECKECRANYKTSKSMMRHMISHQTAYNAPKQRRRYRFSTVGGSTDMAGVDGSGVSGSGEKLEIIEATRKLYQYVLHDGGKNDEKFQRNILARKQMEKEEKERKMNPKPSYLKSRKNFRFKRKENMLDRERSRIVDRTKVLERLKDKKRAREAVRHKANAISEGSQLIQDKDNSKDIQDKDNSKDIQNKDNSNDIQAKDNSKDMEEVVKDLENIGDEDINKGKENSMAKSSRNSSLMIIEEDRKLTSSEEADCLTDNHFCETCSKVFSSSGKLLAHQLFHETIEEFRCKECDFVCKASQTFHKHMNTHYDQPFNCDLCDKKYGHKWLFLRHMKNVHFIDAVVKKHYSKYTCCFCPYTAESLDPVAKHLKGCEDRKKAELQMEDLLQLNCVLCDKKYGHKWLFLRHMKTVHFIHAVVKKRYAKYSCCFCAYTAESLDPVASHLEECEDRKKADLQKEALLQFDCVLCDKKYGHKWLFLRHMKNIHFIHAVVKKHYAKYSCCFCAYTADSVDPVAKHLKECEDRKKADLQKTGRAKRTSTQEVIITQDFIESIPDAQTSQDKGWLRVGSLISSSSATATAVGPDNDEVKTNPEDTPRTDHESSKSTPKSLSFKCKECPKEFPTNKQLWNHMRHHQRKHSCKLCTQKFFSQTTLMIHMRKHSNERPYRCPLCPRSFASEKALDNHHLEHTDAKPYKCEPCHRGFSTKKQWYIHNDRWHKNRPEKFFPCSMCDKKYKSRTTLRNHEESHLGIKRFSCDICKRAFKSKYSVQQHMFIHTGEKPFECKICGKKFALNHLLDRHAFNHLRDLEEDAN